MMIDLDAINRHVERAVAQYEDSAPALASYLEGLYLRLAEDRDNVRLSEVLAVLALREEGAWEQANFASNRLYHLMDRIGLDTTGHVGF